MRITTIICALALTLIACGQSAERGGDNGNWNLDQNDKTQGAPCQLDDCAEGYYCHFDDDLCGDDGAVGQCQREPDFCEDADLDVCGCDGKMRFGPPSCVAAADGVDTHPELKHCLAEHCPDPDDDDVDYIEFDSELCDIDIDCPDNYEPFEDGECGCGCIASTIPEPHFCELDDCPDGYYCHFDDGVCGETGGSGVCEPLPTVCTDDDVVVCGCDGMIYVGSSSCAAQHDGGVDTHMDMSFCRECHDPEDPDVHYVSDDPDECMLIDFTCEEGQELFNDDCGCGCITVEDEGRPCDIDDCPEGYYCHYDDDVCGADGAEGVCEPVPSPTVCTGDMGYHCGCDGTFYEGSSTCPGTYSAGVDVDSSEHSCTEP